MAKVESTRRDKTAIQVDGKWHPLSEAVQKFIGDKDLYQKDIDYELSGNVISKITIKGGSNALKKPNNQSSQENVDWDAKERRIIRQNSESQSAAFMDILQKEGHLDGKDPETLTIIFFEFAKKCEEWVYRDNNNAADIEEEKIQ